MPVRKEHLSVEAPQFNRELSAAWSLKVSFCSLFGGETIVKGGSPKVLR